MPRHLPQTPTNYDNWRKLLFKRDNYTCQDCGNKAKTLHAHHIMRYIHYENLRYKLDNGKTLCVNCHKQYHKKGL
uniref:Putative homing endonuclease n=1 Tax=viral metagenome TaxID=1070528 RepID=A0A6M3JQ88_9ZZZZ